MAVIPLEVFPPLALLSALAIYLLAVSFAGGSAP